MSLWNRESGRGFHAASGSGAYGIPQALPCREMVPAGADWQTNPATQLAWGLGYIAGRYSKACGVWAHSQSTGWNGSEVLPPVNPLHNALGAI